MAELYRLRAVSSSSVGRDRADCYTDVDAIADSVAQQRALYGAARELHRLRAAKRIVVQCGERQSGDARQAVDARTPLSACGRVRPAAQRC